MYQLFSSAWVCDKIIYKYIQQWQWFSVFAFMYDINQWNTRINNRRKKIWAVFVCRMCCLTESTQGSSAHWSLKGPVCRCAADSGMNWGCWESKLNRGLGSKTRSTSSLRPPRCLSASELNYPSLSLLLNICSVCFRSDTQWQAFKLCFGSMNFLSSSGRCVLSWPSRAMIARETCMLDICVNNIMPVGTRVSARCDEPATDCCLLLSKQMSTSCISCFMCTINITSVSLCYSSTCCLFIFPQWTTMDPARQKRKEEISKALTFIQWEDVFSFCTYLRANWQKVKAALPLTDSYLR